MDSVILVHNPKKCKKVDFQSVSYMQAVCDKLKNNIGVNMFPWKVRGLVGFPL